jgi:hypothetical protein
MRVGVPEEQAECLRWSLADLDLDPEGDTAGEARTKDLCEGG